MGAPQLKIVVNIIKESNYIDKEGKSFTTEKIIKKGLIYKKTLRPEKVISISESWNNSGVLLKKRCVVNIEGEGPFSVFGSYEDTIKAIYGTNNNNKIGF